MFMAEMEDMLQLIRNCEHLENLCDMEPLGIGEGGAAAAHYENPRRLLNNFASCMVCLSTSSNKHMQASSRAGTHISLPSLPSGL